MPLAAMSDGTRLYYESTGSGYPLLFSHEFAGDYRSWEPQVRYFARRYRVIVYNARGYPPSDVPEEVGAYSQARAMHDIAQLLEALQVPQAHVVGLSMGGYATCISASTIRRWRAPWWWRGAGTARWRGTGRNSMRTPPRWRTAFRATECRPWRRCIPRARRGCSLRTRTRAAGRNLPTSSANIRPPARR